jgi:hypothetical protein
MEKVLKRFSKYSYQIIAFFILGVHFLFIISFFEPAFSTPDANGYFKQGQLIADHRRTWFQDESPIQYVGFQWMEAKGNRFYSRYPPGLPVIIAIFYKLFGPDSGPFVNHILTTLTLLGLFFLCSVWIGKGWALVATTIMVCNPVINTGVFMNYSHAPVAFFLVWGLVFLVRWSQTLSIRYAFIAGFLLGCIPAIRYAEVLFGLGIAVFILLHFYKNKKAWPSVSTAVIGAAIPMICLLAHNYIAFGAMWKTAYSLTQEQTGFSVDYFAQNIGPYLKHIVLFGAGPLSILSIVGLSILYANKDTRKQGILLVLLIFPTTLLYMSYYFRPDNFPFATMRFLLPTFYIYAIACVWGLKIISQTWKKAASAIAVVLLAANTLWGMPQTLVSSIMVKDADASLCAVEKVVSEHVKQGSLLVIEGLSYALEHIIQTRYIVVDGRIKGVRSFHESTKSRREAGSLMAISHHLNRKIKMLPFMPSKKGDLPEELLNELDRFNSHDKAIYIIGKIEKIKEKIPPDDRLSVIEAIEPPSLLFWKIKKMVPYHLMHLNLLKAWLWNGLFFLNEFVVTPLGIIELTHNDGGLQLIKWTRNIDNS